LVKIIAYRLIGYLKYKLPISTKSYWREKRKSRTLINKSVLSKKSDKWCLPQFNLDPIGIKIKMYCGGIQHIFLVKQYEYLSLVGDRIGADINDTVFDVGSCWGDSALYFANLVKNGRVYAFEPNNKSLKILKTNLKLNPNLQKRIKLIERPLWSSSNQNLHIVESGPGTTVHPDSLDTNNDKLSISIDDFVSSNKIKKLDFIKMDIEGAELPVLKGASKVIKRFKPKLAISIYHSLDDFVNIPNHIKSTYPFYNLYLKHATSHNEETVLFARTKTK
jgi:FkbM family methyltransferase